jgi:hypothetical protein
LDDLDQSINEDKGGSGKVKNYSLNSATEESFVAAIEIEETPKESEFDTTVDGISAVDFYGAALI